MVPVKPVPLMTKIKPFVFMATHFCACMTTLKCYLEGNHWVALALLPAVFGTQIAWIIAVDDPQFKYVQYPEPGQDGDGI